MKTNQGQVNNRYSQEMEEIRKQERFNNIMNVIIAFVVAFGIGLIISFVTLPR